FSKFITLRRINKRVCTIAKPEKIAPATKYGGKMVVCHPGITEVAKSIDTIVWTESTSGVEIPARIKETISKRCHVLTEPFHPKDRTLYIFCLRPVARSRTDAISGKRPQYQNTNDTVK